MVECLKHEGTSHNSSDLLEICVKMGASWSAHVLRQAGDTPSGPGAFLLLFSLKTLHTSSSLIFSGGAGDRGVAGGVNGCVERCSGRCGVFFHTYNKTHSDHLPVVDSPECWGVVSCNW